MKEIIGTTTKAKQLHKQTAAVSITIVTMTLSWTPQSEYEHPETTGKENVVHVTHVNCKANVM